MLKKKVTRTSKILKCFLIAGILLIVIRFYYWAFFDMERLTGGDLLTEEISPGGTYTVTTYVTSGGATVDFSVRGELVWNETREKKNVYWNYRESTANIEWIDDNTVIINGQRLDVPKETFDFRRPSFVQKLIQERD